MSFVGSPMCSGNKLASHAKQSFVASYECVFQTMSQVQVLNIYTDPNENFTLYFFE